MELTEDLIDSYWKAIDQLEAQKVLIDLKVADFPNAKRESRTATHRFFHKIAYPKTHDTSAPLTTAELANRLKVALHGK